MIGYLRSSRFSRVSDVIISNLYKSKINTTGIRKVNSRLHTNTYHLTESGNNVNA